MDGAYVLFEIMAVICIVLTVIALARASRAMKK